MIFRLQVYYCCWKELMEETTKDFPDAQVDLIFSGGSRHHSESCPVLEELQRRYEEKKSKTGISLSDFRM